MARTIDEPRIVVWRGKHYVFSYDHDSGRPVRQSCETFDPPAKTAKERLALLRRLTLDEKQTRLDRQLGKSIKVAYQFKLVDALNEYLSDVDKRVIVLAKNPDAEGGLRNSSAVELRRSIKWLLAWLEDEGLASLATGELSTNHLQAFFLSLATGTSNHGRKEVVRSRATLNKHRRNVASALAWISRVRPARFPDFADLQQSLKARQARPAPPSAFSPAVLTRFYGALIARERPDFIRIVQDSRSKRRGSWPQPSQATSATPISQVFLLCALTGARLGEVLAMRWSDLDLNRGRLHIFAQKTRLPRILPLTGAVEGEVAPGLVDVLRRWKLQAGDREYVLPHEAPTEENPQPRPTFRRAAWVAVAESLKLRAVTPQSLRQNMCSYLASIGVPSDVAAQWLGHHPDVALRYYRAQVLDRNPGRSVEEAMGLRIDPNEAEGEDAYG